MEPAVLTASGLIVHCAFADRMNAHTGLKPGVNEKTVERSFDAVDERRTFHLHSPIMADVTIETIKNGPYIVKGAVELIDADGNAFPVEKRMALCRCGASTEKPFCDGTHSKIGFQAAEKAVPESAES
jgi:CDGSH-type Zn-finger protein